MDCTIATTTDGFGAQYQKILQTYIFCKFNNSNFLYKPFSVVEHNYDNDINYVDKVENLINLKNNITNINPKETIRELDYNSIVRPFFESNIDLCCQSEHMKFIKDCYWSNKDKNFFNNDNSVYLHSLEVLPEYRGNGYGMMLMKKLLELVKNMGYKYATYISDKNNTQAEKIYNNLGRKIYHTDDKSNFSFFQLH